MSVIDDEARRQRAVTKWAEITSGGRFDPAKNTPIKWQDIVDLLHSDSITPRPDRDEVLATPTEESPQP
jgi:hypothetical protein